MSAMDELTALINDSSILPETVANKLHYTYQTSISFNERAGHYLIAYGKMIELFKRMGYIDPNAPLTSFASQYVAELSSKAIEMYRRLEQEGVFANRNYIVRKVVHESVLPNYKILNGKDINS